MIRPGIGRDDHRWNPETQPVVRGRSRIDRVDLLGVWSEAQDPPEQPEPFHRILAGNVVGLRRGRWRHVVVVAAVLVVEPDQKGPRLSLAGHDGVDHLRRKGFALLDVLRILFGPLAEVRVHDADRRQ